MAAINWTNFGGYLANPAYDKKFQMGVNPITKYRQFCDIKSATGKNKGDTVNWLKVYELGNTTTIYGRQILETDTIPEGSAMMSKGTLTITEYGLSIPLTEKAVALSENDLNNITKNLLLHNAAKVFDGTVEQEFAKTPLRYVATGTSTGVISSNSTAAGTNASYLNTYHIDAMVAHLKQSNVPGFGGLNGDYVFIGSPATLAGIKGAMTGIYQYTELGLKYIANGEIGRYNQCRFVESNFGGTYILNPVTGGLTAVNWINKKSLPGYIFGGPTVREGVATPEGIRIKIPTDFGRSQGIAWYALLGWKLEWETADQARIMKWDSVA